MPVFNRPYVPVHARLSGIMHSVWQPRPIPRISDMDREIARRVLFVLKNGSGIHGHARSRMDISPLRTGLDGLKSNDPELSRLLLFHIRFILSSRSGYVSSLIWPSSRVQNRRETPGQHRPIPQTKLCRTTFPGGLGRIASWIFGLDC